MSGYRIVRGGLVEDPLTGQQAAELFRRHSACRESELAGDLETGFHFWAATLADAHGVLKLVRCRVTPVAAPADGHGTAGG